MPADLEPQPTPGPPADVGYGEPLLNPETAVPPPRLRWKLPLALYLLTWGSTFFVAAANSGFAEVDAEALATASQVFAALPGALWLGTGDGLLYAAALMTILTAHELGHYFQARRNGVPASLPHFIPVPLPPFGTMGAIIAMRSHVASTRALFDLAISGPLAGLLPALVACYVGLRLSTFEAFEESAGSLGVPIIFELMARLAIDAPEPGYGIVLHPLGYAGWVGLFITALNLMPIGQLDGGHILYTLLPNKAYAVSVALVSTVIAAIVVDGVMGWSLGVWPWSFMIAILVAFGLRHPPTADGRVPLDRKRQILGWLTLLFIFIGFTPRPFPH